MSKKALVNKVLMKREKDGRYLQILHIDSGFWYFPCTGLGCLTEGRYGERG